MTKGAVKGKTTDGPISRYLNRRISNRITNFILEHEIPITPNQVSLTSFLIGMVSAIFYSQGHLIWGAIFLETSSIIDGVDGELARARNISSPRGGYLDTMLDRFVDICIYFGILWSFLWKGSNILPLMILSVFLAMSGDLLVTYFHGITELKLDKHPALIGIIPPLASRDVRLFILFLGTLVGFVVPTLIIIAVLSYAYVVIKFIEIMLST